MGFSLWLKPVLIGGFNWIGQNFANPEQAWTVHGRCVSCETLSIKTVMCVLRYHELLMRCLDLTRPEGGGM